MTVDFHSHILPCLDDGSSSPKQSIAMLRQSMAQGVGEVILTPHFYAHQNTPGRFLKKRAESLALLLEWMDPAEPLPALRCGAEVYYFPGMSQSDAMLDLAIEGTNCVLVEMPMGTWTEQMYRELGDIHRNLGLTPIVAHVDRYLGRFFDHGIPRRLGELPVLVQANASCFLSGTMGMRLLRQRRIHLLGSDCHDLRERRPNLGPAVKRIRETLGPGAVRWINEHERIVLG